MYNSEIFAKRLKESRMYKNLTQKQLAEKANITAATVSAYEKNTKNPSLENVVNLAEVLEVSLDWLCGNENMNKEPETYAYIIRNLINLLDYITYSIEVVNDNALNFYYSIAIHEIVLEPFLEGLGKMKNLLDNKTIDRNIFDSWIEGQLERYKSYPLKNIKK